MHGWDRRRAVMVTAIAVVSAGGLWSPPANAESIEAALTYAYRNNPQLNAQRAQARAIDETVPQALSGYRPKVAITASGGPQYLNEVTKTPGSFPEWGRVTIALFQVRRNMRRKPASRRRCLMAL